MVFSINGTDITPYIAFGGLKWQRADVDGPNAGRAMNGDMQRDRVAVKTRWDVTCRPLTSSELSTVLQLIQPEYVSVTCTDPITNTVQTNTFYSNNIPASYSHITPAGVEYWVGFTFPLIQK